MTSRTSPPGQALPALIAVSIIVLMLAVLLTVIAYSSIPGYPSSLGFSEPETRDSTAWSAVAGVAAVGVAITVSLLRVAGRCERLFQQWRQIVRAPAQANADDVLDIKSEYADARALGLALTLVLVFFAALNAFICYSLLLEGTWLQALSLLAFVLFLIFETCSFFTAFWRDPGILENENARRRVKNFWRIRHPHPRADRRIAVLLCILALGLGTDFDIVLHEVGVWAAVLSAALRIISLALALRLAADFSSGGPLERSTILCFTFLFLGMIWTFTFAAVLDVAATDRTIVSVVAGAISLTAAIALIIGKLVWRRWNLLTGRQLLRLRNAALAAPNHRAGRRA